MSTLVKSSCMQSRREPPVTTAHIDIAHEAILTIPKTSAGVGAETLEKFLRKHPQIDTQGGVPRYLVMGSLAVAALTGNQRCWEDCADISLLHAGNGQDSLSTSLTMSQREKGFAVIRVYELQECSTKLNSRAHVRCAQVVNSENKPLCNVLVPHPAVLTVLTAADVFDACNDARTARDCEALLGVLEGVEREELSAQLREWRKLIRDTYEGLRGGKRESAHHALERAVTALAKRSANQEFLQLIPEIALNDLSVR